MNASAHPTREQLSALLLGSLDPNEVETLLDHLETCVDCETTLQELEASESDSFLEDLRQPAPVDEYADEPELRAALADVASLKEQSEPTGEATISALGTIDQYTLLEKLGEGGMGAVYKARQTMLDKIVAVKVLPKGRIEDESARTRFEREMKAVGRLEHPNIVRAMDARRVEGQHLLVMEYVDGQDLNELVRCAGPLPVADACEMVRQAALGLQCAHEHGLVHRDIKPSNLMITQQGQIKLLDLGLARFHSEDAPAGREVTAAGQIMGTPDYMAPEQISDTHAVDIRADIYALGCTLYKLLAGRPPFSGPDYRTAFDKQKGHVDHEPPSIGRVRMDVSDELVTVVDKMLIKDPEERFATPAEVAEAMEPFAAGCDLPGMLKQAKQIIDPDEGSLSEISTEDRSSALAGTVPQIAAPEPVGKRGRWTWVAVGAALAGVVALGVILTLTNRYGTLVVECDDPNVQVAVMRNGKEVEVANAESGWTIRLKSGEYDVELKGGNEQFQIDQDSVVVKRGDEVVVRVALKRPDKPKLAPFDPSTVKPLRTLEGHTDRVEGVAFSPDGRRIISGGGGHKEYGEIKVWDTATGEKILTIKEHTSPVRSVAFSPDGRRIVSGGEYGTVKVWNVATSEATLTFKGHMGAVFSLAFSPNGRQIASGSWDRTAKVWDAATGKEILTFNGHTGPVCSVVFSPDGSRIVSGSYDGTAKVWDAATGKEILTLKGHTNRVLSVRFSLDGRWIVSGSQDKTVKVWEAATGEEIRTLKGHADSVNSVAFSPDGKWIVSGSQDKTVRLWDAEIGKETLTLKGHTHDVNSVAFSPDGRQIVSGSADITIKLWGSPKIIAATPPSKPAPTQVEVPKDEKEITVDLPDGVKMDFVLIPAGKFLMGNADGEADEKPEHQVTITKPFYLGKYEVTQDQWRAVMGANPSKFLAGANPVEQISWDESQAFLRRLNAKRGMSDGEFRLPTEAQWEYACRAGSTTRYCFGNDPAELGDYGWWDKNADGRPHPVGQKKPNAWGLYDMHGNVFEWCADWYGEGYYGQSPSSDPMGPLSGKERVLRGGAWDYRSDYCRSSYRQWGTPAWRHKNLGLRVVFCPNVLSARDEN